MAEFKSIIMDAVYTLILAIIIRAFLFFFGYQPKNFIGEIEMDFIIFVISSVSIFIYLVFRIRAIVAIGMQIDSFITRKKIRKQSYNPYSVPSTLTNFNLSV